MAPNVVLEGYAAAVQLGYSVPVDKVDNVDFFQNAGIGYSACFSVVYLFVLGPTVQSYVALLSTGVLRTFSEQPLNEHVITAETM